MVRRVFEAVLVLASLGVFLAIVTPNIVHQSPDRAWELGCTSNANALDRAIEQYNMDHPISNAELDQVALETLLRPDYLRSPITKATRECSYVGTNLASGGRVRCRVHGTYQDYQLRQREKRHWTRKLTDWITGE